MYTASENAIERLIGQSSAIQSIKDSINILAGLDVTVLLLGEEGTGRSLIATYIHEHSQRKDYPLYSVNCSVLSEAEQYANLFLCEKTNSKDSKRDLPLALRAASGGTLFIKEINKLELKHQARLFQFLDSGRLPGIESKIDVRIIASSSVDLYELVKQNRFRSDLYYLLNRIPITVPALRERPEDILALFNYYLRFFATHYFVPPAKLSSDTEKHLVGYHWPGNIRELRNLCEKLALLGSNRENREIGELDLPLDISGTPGILEQLRLPEQGISLYELEKALLKKALQVNGGNQSRAANWLGLSRDTFLYRIRKYTIATK